MRAPLVVVVAAAFLGLFGSLHAGCTRQCQDPSNCIRTCDCIDDSANGRRISCPMAFQCNVDEGTCDPEYATRSCDDICQTFASRDVCGGRICRNERDCDRPVLCTTKDAQGAVVSAFDCAPVFECDLNVGVCEAAASLSEAEICASQQCAGQALSAASASR
jgi:hypothetical protein